MNALRRTYPALLSGILLFNGGAVACAAPSLGRLFLSPEQRTELDRQLSPLPPEPAIITFDGIVRRSSGGTTIWLNRQPLYRPTRASAVDGEPPPLSVRTGIPPSRIAVTVAPDRPTAHALPGYSIELTVAGNTPRLLGVGDSLDLDRRQQRPLLGNGRLLITTPAARTPRAEP